MSKDLPSSYTHAYELGTGAYGCVNMYYDSETKQFYAVKTIQKNVKKDQPRYIEQSLIELKHFEHPHIVKGIRAISTNEHLHLVFEAVSNGELFGKTHKLSLANKIIAIRQIISALIYCHNNGIIHGDVKLENILIQKWDPIHVKLCDFGLSFIAKFDRSGSSGTTEMMAPEMTLAGSFPHPNISYPSDVWSLGIAVYELLYDCCPFGQVIEPEDKHVIKQWIRKGKFRFPSWVQNEKCPIIKASIDFISKLLVVDPNKRMSLKKCLKHPFLNPWKFQTNNFIRESNLTEMKLC